MNHVPRITTTLVYPSWYQATARTTSGRLITAFSAYRANAFAQVLIQLAQLA